MMKPPTFLEQFANRPVMISTERLHQFLSHVASRRELIEKLGLSRRAQGPDDEGNNDFEKWFADYLPNNRVKYSVKNGVATVPVQGVITRMTSRVERMFYGLCDIDMVASDLQRAAADPSARVIKLAMNSPGGGCAQVPEVASLIQRVGKTKPVVACIDELCASACAWLAMSANAVAMTTSAEFGSIGVYIAFLDYSKWLAEEGISIDLIKSSELKATGYPGTSLSPEQRAYLQADVDECYLTFVSHVRAMRGQVPDEAVQGQTFSAEKAKSYGLIDEIYPDTFSLDEALAKSVA
jgi:signal peptide peptidase SppA